MKNWITYIVIGAMAAVIVFLLLRKPEEPKPKIKTVVVNEMKHDTVTHYLPKFVSETLIKYDTIYVRDTILVEVPITQREYQDSTYHAYISGYKSNLDSIEVFQRTMIVNTITTEKVVVNGSKWVITAGLNVGVGYVTPFNSGSGTIGSFAGFGVGFSYAF